MSCPPVTVVMPVKNVAPYVGDAIDSILNQSFTDFRFLIIDDFSSDLTPEIVNDRARRDKRIEFVEASQPGFVNCLNLGIQLNESPFIARMDGDDLAHPERFKRQFEFMQANTSIGVCGSWIRLFGEKEEVWHYREWDEHIKNLMLFKRSGFGHNVVMLRKEVYDKVRYEPEFEFCEDYRLWCKLAALTDVKFHNLQEVLIDYRIHSTQVIATKQKRQAHLREQILKDFMMDLGVKLSDQEFSLLQLVREGNPLPTEEQWREAKALFHRIRGYSNHRFPDKYTVIPNWMKKIKPI